MILIDSLCDTHGYDMIVGIGITIILLIEVLLTLYWVDREQRKSTENNVLLKYIRLKMEESRLNMIRICKECIQEDIQMARPVADMLNEFSGYDDEHKMKEMEKFHEIAISYDEIIKDRSSIIETLDSIIDRDLKNILVEIALIEHQYPEEIAAYNNEHNNNMKHNKQNDETQNNRSY